MLSIPAKLQSGLYPTTHRSILLPPRGLVQRCLSIGEDGGISDFSNRCGIAADFCIAAPGELFPIATEIDFDDYYGLNSGTSFAASMVSGGLITLKKLFRDQLPNEELVSCLFSTANDDGIYANSAIYGHGLMDLGVATKPLGDPWLHGAGGSPHTRATGPTTA